VCFGQNWCCLFTKVHQNQLERLQRSRVPLGGRTRLAGGSLIPPHPKNSIPRSRPFGRWASALACDMLPLVHTTLTTFYHYHCVFKTVLSNIIRHIQNVNSDQVRCSICRTNEFGVNDNEKTRKKLRRNTKGQDEPGATLYVTAATCHNYFSI